MKIEPNKFYRTRCDKKFFVVSVSKPGDQPVVAWDREGYVYFCNSDGTFLTSRDESDFDIIAPWIDKPVVDWGKMPAWAKWVACSDLGNWSWFSAKPSMENGFVNLGSGYSGSIPPEYAPAWTGDWRESLVERPAV